MGIIASILGSPPRIGAAIVEGNTAFALELFSQLKTRPGNLFFSPYSISTALAMTYAGARGETETQMARVLHLDKDQSQAHAAFGELQHRLLEASKQHGIELNIANALWAQNGYPFLPAFSQIATGQYQANVNQVDFKTQAEAAIDQINRWVAEQTRDRIQGVLPPGSLGQLTRLVLANAIYFKGRWAEPFDKAATSKQPFFLSTNHQAGVPLMHHFDDVKYMADSDFQAVELAYGDNEFSMVVLLPREVDGCSRLESRLNPALLSRVLNGMKRQNVEIFLPRFKLESSFGLAETLAAMGMPDAFDQHANFSGMARAEHLSISGVFHKAWGEVNEEGTEAAAATIVAVAGAAFAEPPPPPPVFRADHPFLFLIRDVHSGSLLFLGRLTDPAG